MNISKVESTVILMFIAVSCYSQSTISAKSTLKVDEIIRKHVEALGGMDSIKAVHSLFYTGNSGQKMSVGRPYYKLVGDKNNPNGYIEGYDGSAWEWFENPGIVIRTVGEPSEAIRHYAGVENPLVNYADKGSRIEIIGEIEFDKKPAILLKLVRRDNFEERFYIDKQTFLVLASSYDAPLHAFGEDITTLTRFSEYKKVAGVMIAHTLESVEMPSGESLGSVQWTIIANKKIPPDWFSPPDFERTPIQNFIEQLYNQRDDILSVMWTYEEFRRADTTDTSDPVNIAGYQMLKTGQVQNAILLLQQNVRDNPRSANSRFGLGRAYRTANDNEKAKAQFVEALKIDPNHNRSRKALEQINVTNNN